MSYAMKNRDSRFQAGDDIGFGKEMIIKSRQARNPALFPISVHRDFVKARNPIMSSCCASVTSLPVAPSQRNSFGIFECNFENFEEFIYFMIRTIVFMMIERPRENIHNVQWNNLCKLRR